MTLDELRNKHPEIYNQIFNLGKKEGVEEINENVSAHMEYFDIAPEMVAKNIQEGIKFSMKHLAAYNKAGMNRQDAENRQEDNPEEVETPDVSDTEDIEVEKMTENILNHMKPKQEVK